MPKDYRFKTLKLLYYKGTAVNIRPVFNGFIGEQIQDRAFFEGLLYSLRDDGFIWINDGEAFSLEAGEAYGTAHPIMAKLEQKGIYEYYGLRNIVRRKSLLDIVAVVLGATASVFIILEFILRRIFHVI